MSVGQFVLWYATAATPEGTRRATNTKLTPPPLPINIVTYVCVCAVALPLLGWADAAVPFILGLVIFPVLWPLLIVNAIVLPAILIGGLPFCLELGERLLARCVLSRFEATNNRGADPTNDAQARALLLKVFATIMCVSAAAHEPLIIRKV